VVTEHMKMVHRRTRKERSSIYIDYHSAGHMWQCQPTKQSENSSSLLSLPY